MPGGMNGIELARELKRRRPNLPVILATGYTDARDGQAVEGLHILAKPYRLDALEAALRDVCDGGISFMAEEGASIRP
jgi:DNA-binding LytR/AlgR family response regulator